MFAFSNRMILLIIFASKKIMYRLLSVYEQITKSTECEVSKQEPLSFHRTEMYIKKTLADFTASK